MRLIHVVPLIAPMLFVAASCEASPQPVPVDQVIVQAPQTVVVPAAPMRPPPPMSELVPPPPASAVPTVWQPGHWRYTGVTGNPWSWRPGQYVTVPSGATAWVPGQWQQQGPGWVWREGHWA
ncbi:MAG TPA: hypothetical protein VGM42_14030 [Rhodopila sp.]